MAAGEVVKLAVVGGGRGRAFVGCAEALAPRLEITAVCDPDEEVRARWREMVPGIECFAGLTEALQSADCNAVLVSTPMPLHAQHSLEAMRAGKHVLSEVIACTTVDEGRELVSAAQSTGLTYMMAENCCYFRENMIVNEMARRGLFGRPVYAECAYIHDCRALGFGGDGELTWRGVLGRDTDGDWYPTHALGPVAQWFGIGRERKDGFDKAWTVASGAFARPAYAAERFGPDHPAAGGEFWSAGDATTTLISTRNGGLISLHADHASPRPHHPTTRFELRGTEGAFVSPRTSGDDPLVWIKGRSPGDTTGYDAEWESIWTYAEEFEHPLWRRYAAEAGEAGHGGSDLMTLAAFVDSVLDGTRPPIDVYDAVTWSSLMPVSVESRARGGAAVEIPEFSPPAAS